MDWETIETRERDGWQIEIAISPDWEYRPGYDDDIYPRMEPRDYGTTDPEPRDYDGQFLPRPIIVSGRSDEYVVTPDEIARLTELWGGSPRRARKIIADDAAAIAGEMLSWIVVRVTVRCGAMVGADYLHGVDYDLRQRDPNRYALEIAEDQMVDEAIHDAAKMLGGLAALALSY